MKVKHKRERSIRRQRLFQGLFCLIGHKLGAQLGPMNIAKLSPYWACQKGSVIALKFCCLGRLVTMYHFGYKHSYYFVLN